MAVAKPASKPAAKTAPVAPSSPFAGLLKGLAGKWGNATVAAKANAGGDVPDGRYRCLVGGAEMEQAGGGTGRLQIKWLFVPVDGDSIGVKIRDYQGLETEKNLEFVAERLLKFDVDVSQLDIVTELEDTLRQIVEMNLVCVLQVSTRGDYTNYRVRSEEEEAPEPPKPTKAPAKTAAKTPAPAAKTAPTPPAKPAAKGKAAPVVEEPEEEEEEEIEPEEAELEVGSRVEWVSKGVTKQGVVTKILEADGKAHVRKDEDGKLAAVGIDVLAILTDDEEVDG